MPDLLTHVLIAYVVATLLSWRYDWLTPAYVTVVMAGAMIPDLAKADLVIPSEQVERVLGLPFDWFALHTSGGVIVAILVGIALVRDRERRRVGALLALGGATHLVGDGLLVNPSGRSYAMFWPFIRYHPPTPGLFLSTDVGPALVAGSAAVAVWMATRYWRR